MGAIKIPFIIEALSTGNLLHSFMGNGNIDIPPLFKYSYQLFKQYASFVIGIATTYFILGIVPQVYLFIYTPKDPTLGSQVISTLVMMLQLFLSLGFIKVMLYLVDHREVEVTDLINNGSAFLSYFVAYFMYVIVVGIGLFLLIIPGIYLAIRLQFYPFYIIEEKASSFEAMQKSWYATENFPLQLFLFGICVLFINFIGALLFGIGVVITYPITTMATAIIYKGLVEKADAIPTTRYLPD